MSIKDLFNNKGVPKIQKSVTSDEMVATVESSDFVEAKRKQFDQFVPPIDFATASNFAKFGSAELYYEKAFERIYNYYPYDGALAEKIEFENSSSYLDKYVFENLYPRTNGYINFDTSTYIDVFGGPHTASAGMAGKPLDSTFDQSMIYDESKKRTSAFEFRGEDGITAEFWLKVDDTTSAYTIFDISGSDGGQIKLDRNSSNQFQLTFKSGSEDGTRTFTTSNVIPAANTWNYYAITAISSSSNLEYKLYRDGQYLSSVTSFANIPSILPVSDGLHMRIGANHSGLRKLSGSIDEFRFWKSERTSEQIFNNWFIPLGGGTNKQDANVDLGLYFKFNEGITGTESLDNKVLDYSGRINNGTITGYNSSTRNTGSAITEKLSEPEFLDPIIYSSHPDVISKKAEYKTSGSLSDLENTSMVYSYFPGWMQEEDEQSGKQLKYLSQVLGSYFDTLWHQISFINKIHGDYYVSGSNKSLPFAKKLLQNKGFVMPDLFVDATLIENLRQKDDNEVFEKEINEVRNTIYHNLYNNLDGIYKSKGTEKAFRNFFRSLGIGQDVVKLKMYADDSTFVLRDNYEYKSYERKFLNFNVDGHFDATIYQTSSANNSNIHIPKDSSYTGSFTFQTEVILPRKQRINEIGFNPFPQLSSSIAGYKEGSDYVTAADGLQIYVVHSESESSLNPDDKQRVKFVLTGSNTNLESDWYWGQYENNKWSLAVRMKHSTYPRPNITGSSADDYLVEFYGVEADGNTKRNSFLLTTASVAQSYYSSDKIFYAGANRTQFTGSTLNYSDVKLGYVRYWHSYLSNDAIDQHAFDSETFGANEPFEQDLVNVYPVEIPREKTLSFHWAFNDLTGSDSSGELLVSDLSSGSLNSDYGLLSDTIQRYIAAKGEGFNASSTKALDKDFLYSARKRLPDDLMSSDLTTIKTDETEQFFVDEDVSDNFYSFEKSMWGAVSDEMMNMFSTALDLNNLIGQPNQRYHHRYNLADFLRNKFFEDVENEPDLEKFTSFYKWIDDSISIALQQLVPASARFSEKINNIVESHVLERNKYVHQIPITTNFESTEGSIKGHAEMNYNWKFGHAPTDTTNEANNVLWQQDRKEKSGLRENLRNSKNNHSIQSSGLIRREIDGTARLSDTYEVRRFAKTYEIGLASQETIHGGTNFGRKKNLQLFHESIAPAGRLGEISGVPQNVVTVGVGEGQGIVEEPVNNDLSPRKKKYQTEAQIGNRFGDEYGHNIHGDFVLPLNIMSGTVNSGYNATVESLYKSGVHLTNLHNDIVGNNNETSVQGPFTEQHVGGLQYRHVDINHGTDNEDNRPEGWGLSIAEHPVDPEADGALGFLGADYEEPYPSQSPKATRYREEHAKRPVNVRNIKTVSGSWKVGNYRNEIELFSVSPTFQKTWAIEAYNDNSIDILPPFIANNLPSSTHYQTLMGIAPYPSGNVFGAGINGNRQPDTTSVLFSSNYVQADLIIDLDTTRTPQNNGGGIYRIERSNYVLNSGVDETRAILIRWSNSDLNGTILRTSDAIRITVNYTALDWSASLSNLQTTINNHADIGQLIQISNYNASSGKVTIQIAGLIGSDGNGGSFSPTSYSNHFDTYETTFTGGSTTEVFSYSNDNVITIPRTDLTGSQRNIVTRFSAPGGPEVQSIGYLDAYTQTYSVHNSMPFRNLSVLGSGSGEEGTIRVEDHLGLRRGLKTLRALHMGQFGIDSQYGEITSGIYPSSGSFNKQHRNTSEKYVWNGSSDITASLSEPELITDNNYDNAFINTTIPRSELQYSWIHNATSGAAGETYGAPTQRIIGYAPRDGFVSSSAGYVEALVFPTASSIFGS